VLAIGVSIPEERLGGIPVCPDPVVA